MIVTPGATSVRVRFTVLDGDGNPLTTATNSTLTLSYLRDGAASNTSISLSAGTVGTYSSGGVKHIARGVYELGIPDAAVAAGVREVELLGTDTNGQVIPRTINFNWLWIDSDVHALAMHLIMLYSREINVIMFTASGDGILTKLADRVGLTFGHYVGRPLIVREISKHFTTMSCTIFGYDEVKHVLPGYWTADDAPSYDDATAEQRATMGFFTDDDGYAKPGDEDSKVSNWW